MEGWKGENERVCAFEIPFTVEKISACVVSVESVTAISTPALNPLSYRAPGEREHRSLSLIHYPFCQSLSKHSFFSVLKKLLFLDRTNRLGLTGLRGQLNFYIFIRFLTTLKRIKCTSSLLFTGVMCYHCEQKLNEA